MRASDDDKLTTLVLLDYAKAFDTINNSVQYYQVLTTVVFKKVLFVCCATSNLIDISAWFQARCLVGPIFVMGFHKDCLLFILQEFGVRVAYSKASTASMPMIRKFVFQPYRGEYCFALSYQKGVRNLGL